MPRLLFLVTEDWYFCSHRLPLAVAARDAGYHVTVATRVRGHGETIKEAGLDLVPLRHFSRQNGRPSREIRAMGELIHLYRHLKPDIIHHVALKPVVLGTLAASIAGRPRVVNALTGLGHTFVGGRRRKLLAAAVSTALRWFANGDRNIMIFQNRSDQEEFLNRGVVDEAHSVMIPGSGVSLTPSCATRPPSERPLVVCASRMVRDKGILELVAAARCLRDRGIACRVALVGAPDLENPTAISEAALRAWHQEGIIEWWGQMGDVPEVLAQADVACLPSYREGLSKFLLEAAAASLPIVTTDAPGCRELVRDGENGFLVPVRDVESLAHALERILKAGPEVRAAYGRRSREIVEPFGAEKILSQTLALYARMLAR